MNDREKSDSGIVAVKPANKLGQPGAEPVEPRPGTKGNVDQQSTHRTQGRARVTQALGRVRQAARQGKKERFTALLHHITIDTLRMAFYALKRKAAAGVDGVTWEDYEADIEPRLGDLHARVHKGAYRPQPSRQAGQPTYIAHVALAAKGIETENGFSALESGMAVTAEIKTGRRSIASYILSPLRRLKQEGLRER